MSLTNKEAAKPVDYLGNLRQIQKNFEQMLGSTDTLRHQLNQKEAEMQDVMHIIENFNFNACEGYNLAKRLQKVRRERRIIKNKLKEQECVKRLLKMYKDTGISGRLVNTMSEITGIRNQQKRSKYHIRQLHELERFNRISEKQVKKPKLVS